jgi:pimeloyl-ACP methyl ester carboxylesterase
VTVQTIDSKDGTTIAFERSGHGPPLVLVHGTTADHTRWKPILPALQMYFTVYALDRRGRGGSGDAPGYEIDREFEDVAALRDTIGQPAFLVGHSYGAICALEAAMLSTQVRKLVLYEPPIRTADTLYAPGLVERLNDLLTRGDREAVVTAFFREVVQATDDELRVLRSLPNWPARLAAADTVPRELRASEEYRFKGSRFVGFPIPTLLLIGGETPALYRDAVKAVHAGIPTAHVAVMPGQHHTAMNTAPEVFLRQVVGFLQRS